MKIKFYKYQGSGNDFIIIDNREKAGDKLTTKQINKMCDRHFGIGADGLMLLNEKEGFDFEMTYFNADGNLGSMCGNGGRCIVQFASNLGIKKNEYIFSASDGAHKAKVDLEKMVSEGLFREDLFYRLNVLPVALPPLRERREDIPMLMDHFIERYFRRRGEDVPPVSEAVKQAFLRYGWPGNVRELENVVERAAVLAAGPIVTLADVRTEFSVEPAVSTLRPTLDELERQYIRRVLDEVQGDKQAAAKILGVSVRTLQRKEKEL